MSVGIETFGRTLYLTRFRVGSCDETSFLGTSRSDDVPWLEMEEREDEASDKSVVIDEEAIDERESAAIIRPFSFDRGRKCCDGLSRY